MRSLKKLSLRGTQIDDSIVEALILSQTIEEVDLGYTSISTDAIRRIATIRSLRLLYVLHCPNLNDDAKWMNGIPPALQIVR
jgi:hypothetical protein